jgi:uncharacterized membrane protein YgcG
MNLDFIKEKKELVSTVLLGGSAVLAILMFIKLTSFFMLSAKAEDVVQRVIENTQTSNQNIEQYFEASRTTANNLINNNLFAPPAVEQRQWPVREIRGIWDNKVQINNQWYAEGQTVQNAKIVSIEPTRATIEWDGETRTFSILDPQIQTQSNERQVTQSGPTTNITSVMPGGIGGATLFTPDGGINMNNMIDAFNSIRNNPETQSLINEMRQRFSGGRGGGMGGRGGFGGGRGGGRGGRGGRG